MQPRPPFNRTLLTLIAVGVISILAIGGWILLANDPGKSPLPATASPSSVGPLEAETLTLSPPASPVVKDETLPTATETGPAAGTEPPASTSTVTMESPATPSATPTPEGIQPLQAGKYYDDTDPNIAYDPHWTALKNRGTANSYKGTIHASLGIGSEASFRFTGKRFRLGYQRGNNFGIVTVMIDDQPYSFNEQAFDLVWRSPELPAGDHFVRIIHESGQTINLDYILIVD
jgi:hypothetical protein